MTNAATSKKLGDKVTGTWRALGRDVAISGRIVSWDNWDGTSMATVSLDEPVLFVSPARYDGDVRHEVTVESRSLTMVEAGPSLSADDIVDMSRLGYGDSLSRSGHARLGIARRE
jgi:hypothetical protein